MTHHHAHDGRTGRHSFIVGSLVLLACMWGWGLGAFGPAYMPQWSYLWGIVVFALVSYIPFLKAHWRKAWVILVTLWLFVFALQHLAVTQCFLYGCFEYSDVLGTKIMWTIPRTIFFSRAPFVLWAARLVHHIRTPMFVQALLGGFFLILIAMLIDPVSAVSGFFTFKEFWPRYGIPWSYFAGRFISGTIGVYLFLNLLHDAHADTSLRNDYLRRSMLLLVMCFTCAALTLQLRWPSVIGAWIFGYFMYHLYKHPPAI